MKKTIALFLAMLMVLSIIPLAFAENETNETADDDGDSAVTVIPADEESADDGSVDDESSDETEDEDGTEVEDEEETEDEDGTEVEDEEETEDEEEIELEIEAEDNETEIEDEEEIELESETEGNETETEEEEEDVVEVPEEVIEEAGVTPDSILWPFERIIERIDMKLTLGKSAKAKKGLAHARQRLLEVQAMIAAKRMGAPDVGWSNSSRDACSAGREIGRGGRPSPGVAP